MYLKTDIVILVLIIFYADVLQLLTGQTTEKTFSSGHMSGARFE